ncbi:hypothetical protein G9A89_003989 [Geosiphon pyriformis]|nr:hypothetical protein G9A89_003989 [Geosiphon pyriformis]
MKKANHTKLVNLAIRETSSNIGNEIAKSYKETNKTESTILQDSNSRTTTINLFHSSNINNLYKLNSINNHLHNNTKYQPEDWFNITNLHLKINFRTITTESTQITSWFPEILVSKDPITTTFNPVISNPSNNTIPPTQIAQNANLSDIFSFEVNESSFLLSNAAVNEQKAITAMYTEAEVEEKPIQLILNSGSAGVLSPTKPAQTVIVTANRMKKTPVGEIDNFSFIIDEIIISIKVLVMNTSQYQAFVENNWLLKTNANLDWETQKLKISYQEQYTRVPAICSTFNKKSKKILVFEFEEEKKLPITKTFMAFKSISSWGEETEQEIFEKTKRWNVVRYFTPEPRKQPFYIPLKCKDCNKKLSSIKACISPEEEYETCICYFCKACHREQIEYSKRSGK